MDANNWAFFFGVIGAYILSGGMLMYQESFKPTAMDVYKGKTTIEVTYRDGGFRQFDTSTGEMIGSSYDEDQEKLGVINGSL